MRWSVAVALLVLGLLLWWVCYFMVVCFIGCLSSVTPRVLVDVDWVFGSVKQIVDFVFLMLLIALVVCFLVWRYEGLS